MIWLKNFWCVGKLAKTGRLLVEEVVAYKMWPQPECFHTTRALIGWGQTQWKRAICNKHGSQPGIVSNSSVARLVLRSSQRSEPTSAQCKACFDNLFRAWRRTSWSCLFCLTAFYACSSNLAAYGYKLLITVAPFKFNSAFRIFILKLWSWAPRFVISTGKVVFKGHNTAGIFWAIN